MTRESAHTNTDDEAPKILDIPIGLDASGVRREALYRNSTKWADVVKIGRTHLEDATPLTVGQEWSGSAGAGPAGRGSRAMRLVELSNHPGDMLNDVSLRRAAAQSQALSGYEDALIQYQARVQTLRVKRDRARYQHTWWRWLRLSFGVWAEKRRVPPAPVPVEDPTDTEEKIRAGIAGEQLIAAGLGRALGDDWTLLRGYRNRCGEIDQLLLGPRGLFAIEVKNINATVYIDGDRWRADKYDNYGNLVEQRPIADRRGRSPSEQLNEPAGELERFLRERGQLVTVRRVVVLAHRRSRLGPSRNPTVLAGTSAGYLLSLVEGSDDELDQGQRGDVERLIRRDHDFHAANRRRRGPGGRRPPARNR